jgi:trimeric autotransporter adhesin
MKRCLASLGATIAVVLAIGAGSAFAEGLPTVTTTTPESGLTQSQSSTQTEQATNDIDQNASSAATSAPGVQSNTNTPVYVGGSGGGGNVTQSNDSTANSGAVNKNDSVQGIDQDESSKQTQTAEQEGGCCADHTTPTTAFAPDGQSQSSLDQSQRSKQSEKAKNDIDQNADSTATSAPGVQSNVNAPVRVGSDGNNGDVNQSNSSTANSFAGNRNNSVQGIDQDERSYQRQGAEQELSGCCGGSSGDLSQRQRSYQKEKAKNDIDQNATSTATSAPGEQTNENAPVSTGGYGSSDNVDQSNSSTANSGAFNKNNSVQWIDQDERSKQTQWAEQEVARCCNARDPRAKPKTFSRRR